MTKREKMINELLDNLKYFYEMKEKEPHRKGHWMSEIYEVTLELLVNGWDKQDVEWFKNEWGLK